jgi:uncharacterized protein (DUF305 family)
VAATAVQEVGASRRLSVPRLGLHPVALVLAAALTLGVGTLAWTAWPRTPSDGSAAAGFVRDMAEHHRQAVQMALIIRDRTADEQLRMMATDIVLTQQAQIGTMDGWLLAWDLSPNGSDPAMAWMGHPTEGLMPGMATAAEIQQLRDLPLPEAEVLFLRLMIRHHVSGVEMAQAALDRVEREEVRFLAEKIAAAQVSEIAAMQQLLAARDQPPEDTSALPAAGDDPEGTTDHGHDG